MATTTRSAFLSRPARRDRWQALRDLLGGGLVLALWLALWTVTWAAVAGPLAPAAAQPDGRMAEYRGL